jgi:transcription elongation factor SPT4
VINPKASWAAKWLRLGKLVPGCYALEINDDVPESVAQEIEERMDAGR